MDCKPEVHVEAIAKYPGCVIGLSALLTTTMVAMRDAIRAIRAIRPDALILVGGAPITEDLAKEIGADAYAHDPSAAIELLSQLKPAA